MKAGDKDATEDDLEGAMVAAEVTVGTTENRVDLSNVAQIVYTFRHRSDASEETYADDLDTQHRSYPGIADEIYRVDRDSVEAAMAGYEEDIRGVMLNDFEDTGETTRTINVEDIDGGRNIGIGVEVSSDFAQEVTLEVFSVRGEDTNGNEVLHLVTTEE
ncbi:hypothetical protein DM826_02125 [Halonotius aquaticus]|uniref:Uncharacterized protein n=1 Tax=Halonotius aquaticus TaxID=2216978 RepID=A0A3A6PYP9_9EURY|nr:hypothetical protein [Halonotius aquaticus]RJX44437.1 hypothetical protein DM826_02125 [Halonotius aquaticus]